MAQRLLILLEHDSEALTEPSRRLCENLAKTAGQACAEISAVIFGFCQEKTLKSLAGLGVKKVYQVPGRPGEFYAADQRVRTLSQLISAAQPCHIILPNTLWSREAAPLLAFQWDAGLVSDCVQLDLRAEPAQVVLNVYNGQYQRICELTGTINVIIMADTDAGVYDTPQPGETEIVAAETTGSESEPVIRVLETFSLPAADLDISEADVVVGIGRGIETAEDWELMKDLAKAAQAPIGGTRPAVDAGWLPFARQIGQTGRIIAPELYLAVGISGAQQHISGVEKAKIVAINSDPQAPILRMADLGVLGDFREIVPILAEKLQNGGKEGQQ